jgi:hypothetical protein
MLCILVVYTEFKYMYYMPPNKAVGNDIALSTIVKSLPSACNAMSQTIYLCIGIDVRLL